MKTDELKAIIPKDEFDEQICPNFDFKDFDDDKFDRYLKMGLGKKRCK